MKAYMEKSPTKGLGLLRCLSDVKLNMREYVTTIMSIAQQLTDIRHIYQCYAEWSSTRVHYDNIGA
jgi:hypothetical protein